MKTAFFIISLLTLFSSKSTFAQTENTISTPKYIVGLSAGIQFHDIDDRMFNSKLNGYGVDVFYRHYCTSFFDSARFPLKMYLSANTGYLHHKNDNVKQENIAVTAGPCLFFGNDFDVYLAAEIGALYRTEEQTLNTNIVTTNGTKLFATLAFGFVFPISKSLNLEINGKENYAYKDIEQHKVNLGFSYSF